MRRFRGLKWTDLRHEVKIFDEWFTKKEIAQWKYHIQHRGRLWIINVEESEKL